MKHITIVRLQSGAWQLRGEVPKNWDKMLFISWEAALHHAMKLNPKEYYICKHKNMAFAA